MYRNLRHLIFFLAALFFAFALPQAAQAMPGFARQYGVSCALCHDSVPRLNSVGEAFGRNNFRLPNWKEAGTINTGDERLVLLQSPQFAIRTQAYVQSRQGEEVDEATGFTGDKTNLDFQAPYLMKLISGAPLSDHLTYYFYAIFAEKGDNGTVIVDDAFFRYSDLFGTGVNVQLGQFQISELMYKRETRMTFQDYIAYRTAGIVYDRGVVFDRDWEEGVMRFNVAVGAVNGNGSEANIAIDSPGYRRPDRMFDNDSNKTLFGRIGAGAGPVSLGVFGLAGKQKDITGTFNRDKQILGLDISGDLGSNVHLYFQGLWNRWKDFLAVGSHQDWFGGFFGVDYTYNDKWAYSLLYNYGESDEFKGSGTVYEGIKVNTLTLTSAYYFMRNVKGILEVNADFLPKDPLGPPFVGHQTKESYVLLGFDAAF